MEPLVRRHNPWWSGERDPVVERWRRASVKWIPEWIKEVSLEPFSLNFVIGPRQVGKTTGLRLLIHRLLEDRSPYQLFYFNCDFTADMEHLRRVLDLYLSVKRAHGLSECFIFLDEVGSTAGWWRVIKGYIDLGALDDCVLTLAGSSTLRLKGEVELFPGRRGKGTDVKALPLTFKEFAEVHGVKIPLSGNLERDIAEAKLYQDKLEDLFKQYLKLGGFPLSINRDERAPEYLLLALEGELLRLGKSPQIAKAIISSIMRKAPSPLSYSAIAKDIGVSYKTVEDYIQTLRKLFLLEIAYHKEGKRILWRKEKKIFFLDPFIANTLAEWACETPLQASIYEWVTQAHLHRKYGEVYYYRNAYEIDCIARNLKIEVKAGKPHRKYPKNTITLTQEDIPPFLYALNT